MRLRQLQDSHQVIHVLFAGMILLVFLYSGIFSPQQGGHPIRSQYKIITGEEPASSGMSRAFSSIVRLDLDRAKHYNPHSLAVFSFFLIQLFLRGVFFFLNTLKIKRTPLVIIDASVSVMLFLYCFKGLIAGMYG